MYIKQCLAWSVVYLEGGEDGEREGEGRGGTKRSVVPAIGHTAEREDLVVHVVQYCVSRMMITGYAAVTPLRRFLHVRLVVLLDGALPSARNSPITWMRGGGEGRSTARWKKRERGGEKKKKKKKSIEEKAHAKIM